MALDLGIDFSNLKEVETKERILSAAASEMATEIKKPVEGNIGSEASTQTSQTKSSEETEVSTFDINDFLGSLDEKDNKESSIAKDHEKDERTKEEITKEKSPSSTKQQSSSNVPFSLVFKSLLEEGALSNFDQDAFEAELADPQIGPALAIQGVFKKEADLVKQEILQENQEDFKEYVNLLDAGVNRNLANQLIQQKANFSTINVTDLEGDTEQAKNYRKAVLIQNYRNSTNFSDDKIVKIVDKAIKAGEDEEEAKEALPQIHDYNASMVKQAKDQAIVAEQQKQQQAKLAIQKYKEVISATDEIVPGQKINKQTKAKIENYVLKGGIWELRNKDPFKFDTIVSYLALNGAFEGKFDKPLAAAKKSALEEMAEALSTTTNKHLNPVTNYTGGGGDEEGVHEEFDMVADMLKKAPRPVQR